MIIKCTKCSTNFIVPDSLITETGRNVKCSKCQNIWFARKEESLHVPNLFKNNIINDAEKHLPAISKERAPILLISAFLSLVFAFIFSIFVMYYDDLIKYSFFSQNLYSIIPESSSGFKLQNVMIKKIPHGNKYDLVIKYQVFNNNKSERKMPLIRLKLLDKNNKKLYSSTITNNKFVFKPGEIVTTQTELHNVNKFVKTLEIDLGNKIELYNR